MASADSSKPRSRIPRAPPYRAISCAWIASTSSSVRNDVATVTLANRRNARESEVQRSFGETPKGAGMLAVQFLENALQLGRALARSHGRNDDDVAVGRNVERRVRIDA